MDTNFTETYIAGIAFQAASTAVGLNSLEDKIEDPIFLDEACLLTGYTKNTLYRKTHRKLIPFHKGNGLRRLFFFKSELIAWIKSGNKIEVKNLEEIDRLITVNEAAKFLKISRVTLWKYRSEGKIKHVQDGKRILFRKEDIENFLGIIKEVKNG